MQNVYRCCTLLIQIMQYFYISHICKNMVQIGCNPHPSCQCQHAQHTKENLLRSSCRNKQRNEVTQSHRDLLEWCSKSAGSLQLFSNSIFMHKFCVALLSSADSENYGPMKACFDMNDEQIM